MRYGMESSGFRMALFFWGKQAGVPVDFVRKTNFRLYWCTFADL